MRAQPGRRKLGVLAVAFDGAGRGVLDALADRPGAPEANIHCCHAVEEGEGRLSWFCRTPGAPWGRPEWGAAATSFEKGLEAAVRTMLDVERWQTPGGGLDLLDLVLLSPGLEPAAGALPPDVPAILKRIRRRFRRIGRILLLADGAFETSGEAAPPGLIRPLPYADGADGGVFDFIILLDRITTEGMAVNDPEEARTQAAGIVHHLTIGELAPFLFGRIQAEQARLSEAGRYLTLGFTEWRLTSELGIHATSDVLYREMAGRLLAFLTAPPEEEPEPADPWLEEVAPAILAEPPASGPIPSEDLQGKLAAYEETSHETLRAALRGAGWRLDKLQPLLTRRLSALKQLEAQTALKLARFMDDTFVRWYAEKQAGRLKQQPPQVFFDEETVLERVIAFTLTCLVGLVGLGVAIFNEANKVPASIFAGAAGIGAILIALKGFKRKIPRPMPSPSLSNWMPELHFRRGQSWLARQLVRRHQAALELWEKTRQALRREFAVPAESIPFLFPFSPEVTSALLQEKSINAAESLHRFWESENVALRAAIGRSDASLSALLREFATECCRPLANLEWSDVFRVIASGDGLNASSWRDALEKARASALPWLPVPGLSLQTFLALPSGLSSDLHSALSQQFPDQKAIEEIEGDAILVFQLTQGYRIPAKVDED